jgi:hypothetical protein
LQALTAKVEAAIPGVEEQKKIGIQDEEATSLQAAAVQAVKDECEADLAEAMPILRDALKALVRDVLKALMRVLRGVPHVVCD